MSNKTLTNARGLLSLLACFLLASTSALAETVIVESRTTNTTSTITPDPPYQEVAPSWSSSGAKSPAVGTTASRPGSRFGFAGTPGVTIKPTLVPGATYFMDATHISINASPDIVVTITYSGCIGTASDTDKFNNTVANVWANIGSITVDPGVTQPEITFTYASGTLASTGGRWYVDAFRFVNQSEPCVTALPELTTVNGPIAAGQAFVDVPGVSGAARGVFVYANDRLIGSKTEGVAEGVNRVTVEPLVEGEAITVTQSNEAGVESCRPSSGPPVGGGANPRVRVALSLRQNTGLIGPIGANGGNTNTIIKFLGATNTVGPLGTAPAGGKVIEPSNDWQTVTFLRGTDPANPTDPSFMWNGTDTPDPNQLKGDFGVLDSIAFAIEDADSGPYAIYIDNFQNGDVVIQDFEAANAGATAVSFNLPSFSGTTSPFLLAPSPGSISPNSSVVTNNTADTGANSAFVSWQFVNINAVNWLRLVAQGSGTPNPQLDLRLPISFRVLLLPVGQTVEPTPAVIASGVENISVLLGGSVMLRITARGAGPLYYQWRINETEIMGATNSTLTISNAQPFDAGSYSVVVSNYLGTATSTNGTLTVIPTAVSQVMTPLWQLAPGSRPYVGNNANLGGLAYNPVSGNLLVVARTGSNAVQVLDGATGDHLRTLNNDPTVITGGTLALNRIGAAADGQLFAGNVTTDGTIEPFKLYRWIDDNAEAMPELVWQGDPGNGVASRWGDSMDVRGSGADTEILLSSRAGNQVAIISPIFGPNSQAATINTDAPGGAFGLSIAFGDGDTFWGKSVGATNHLYKIAFDLNTMSGATVERLTHFPNLAIIGVDPAKKLLAGISLETPDNLRLFDIADPSDPVSVDTEFFPTDNPNLNGTGSVDFAPGRVYALDSNNGIIALAVGNRLRVTRNGNQLVLMWDGPSVLQSSANVNGPYEDVVGATSGYSADLSAGAQLLFRLRD